MYLYLLIRITKLPLAGSTCLQMLLLLRGKPEIFYFKLYLPKYTRLVRPRSGEEEPIT